MKVEITQFAWNCLADIESFSLNKGYSAEQAANYVEGLLLRSVEAITNSPESYRYSPRLAEQGLKMRERLDETSHWCFFELEGDVISLMMFIDIQQDLSSALYRHLLIRE